MGRIRSNHAVSRPALILVLTVLVLGGCARSDRATADATPSTRPPGPTLEARLEMVSPDFPLTGNREVQVTYAVINAGRRAERLQFPTEQRIELVLRGPDGTSLFLWSEDRLFAATPSVVLINPGERLEYAVTVPTRDMVAGREYTAEAGLVGHPGTGASLVLRPR